MMPEEATQDRLGDMLKLFADFDTEVTEECDCIDETSIG